MFKNFLKIKNLKLKIESKWYKQRIKNIGHWVMSWFYVYKNGYPAKKLTVIGVTGTDGKTTTTTLIYEILKAAGIKVGMISTVSAQYSGRSAQEVVVDTGLHTTNPEAKELQPLIKKIVSEGVTHLVLEVTAHGLDQHRVAGCNISIGVLTNLTRDHLDDFISIDRYRKAKLKMFLLPSLKYAILNKDDSSFDYFRKNILKKSNAKITD
jgi:UDP-N-acetylmuramoyl-L-alanyl-D-glutamate--2,6-diaminopimelate ligase